MKMTWLHKLFVLFFVPVDDQGKSTQQLIGAAIPPTIFSISLHKGFGPIVKFWNHALVAWAWIFEDKFLFPFPLLYENGFQLWPTI